MKKTLLYFLTFFFFSTLNSQTDIPILRVDDLMRICKMSSNDIESYAAKRNLEIESLGETNETYIEDVKFRHTKINEYKFRYIKTKNGCGMFTIGFNHLTLFNNQKTKAIDLGFKLISTETYKHPSNDSVNVKLMKYKKGVMTLNFYNILDKEKHEGLPYEITLAYNCD